MLFKTDSINEDVTLGTPVPSNFHCLLIGAANNRPPLMGPILETLTRGLSDITGTNATGCLLSYAPFTLGALCMKEASLRTFTTHSFHGKWKAELSTVGSTVDCNNVRPDEMNWERCQAGRALTDGQRLSLTGLGSQLQDWAHTRQLTLASQAPALTHPSSITHV